MRLSRIIGRHSPGAVGRGEGGLCQDARVEKLAAAMGPAHGAIAAGPGGLEVCLRDRCDAAGEGKERAGKVVFVAGRVDGGARGCVECVQGDAVEDQAARQG